ncbi:MAG: DUF3638 domain-containing protein [Tatlockia sp.]|nr:DUF3638 domain-containing protein [Tatlockia sp.]
MPIIDASLFAHIENDAHLTGTYGLGGNKFSITAQYLKDYLDYLDSEKIEFPVAYTSIYNEIKYLVEIQQRLDQIASSKQVMEEINSLGEQVTEKILLLSVGELLSLPGGWHNSTGGHQVIFEFSHETDGYQFKVINSGDGLNYHAKKSSREKELYNPVKCWIFPTPTSLNEKKELARFIGRLFKPQLPHQIKKQAVTSQVFYEEILTTISYINGSEMEALRLPNYCYTGGQLSPTCTQRVLHQKIKLNSPSFEIYLRFIFGFKLWGLDSYAIKDLYENKQLFTLAVRDQINKAIENNFKILNIAGIFTSNETDKYYKKLRDLQKEINNLSLSTNPKTTLPPDAIPQLVFPETLQAFVKPSFGRVAYQQEKVCKIELGKGENLIEKLNQILEIIDLIIDPATQYYYLEQLILALPVNDSDGLVNTFYKPLQITKNFSQFQSQLLKIQTLLVNLQSNWLSDSRIPSLYHLYFNLMSLQIDTQFEISTLQGLPLFFFYTNSLMKIIATNSQGNPYWASNHPGFDRRLEKLQMRFSKSKNMITLFDLCRYFNTLLDIKTKLNQELVELYIEKYGQDVATFHQQIRKNNLESLFLISQHLQLIENEQLEAKYNPLIELVTTHIDYESRLRIVFNYFLDVPLASYPRIALTDSNSSLESKLNFWTPLNLVLAPFESFSKNLAQGKYSLPESSALKAIKQDLFDYGTQYKTVKTANSIQLKPFEAYRPININRQITQQDIVARDYCYLRSVSTLQIVLTLDYFTRNIGKLSNIADQRYVEANLFQPGLLSKALQNPSFLPQFQDFLQSGYKFFNRHGQHGLTSLLFLRLDFLVSRYLYLTNPSAGLIRLQDIQEQLLKQLSLTNEADVIYVQHQYLFLIEMTRFEAGEISAERFNLLFSAYAYIQSHSNPDILEDKAHSIELACVIAKFKILASQQSEKLITEAILYHFAKSSLTNEFQLLKGKFPIYFFSNGEQTIEMNFVLGKIYENNFARTAVPYFIKHHLLIKHLGLNKIRECLITEDNNYLLLNFENQEVHLFNQPNKLVVQKKWTINSQSRLYELKALTANHPAYFANRSAEILNPSLPWVLLDDNIDCWQDIESPENALLVQSNVPLYFLKSKQFIALDKDFQETKYQLIPLSSKWLSLLNSFESNRFIISEVSDEDTLFKLPRYNLSLQTKTTKNKAYLVLRETGEQIIDEPAPIHPAILGFILSNSRQLRYLVPVHRFYATEKLAEKSDFYPLVHDSRDIIADACLKRLWQKNPPLDKPMWDYQNNEKTISFRLIEGKPIADRVADAIYLAYLYLAANQTQNAWETLEDCNTRLGGLTGDPAEVQFINWICRDLPFLFQGKKISIRETPPYVACQLKAMSLACDFFLQDRNFNLTQPSLDKTANSHYELYQYNELFNFINSLAAMINHSYKRMQAMHRHLEQSYTLSLTERKHLLDYYQQSKLEKDAPRGALGYEWTALNLEFLQQEREALVASEQFGLSKEAALKRLVLIEDRFQQFKPVVAASTILEAVEIDLSLPAFTGEEIQFNQLGKNRFDSLTLHMALDALSSDMTDEEFFAHLPAYYQIAYFAPQKMRQCLENFCAQTLIATRFIKKHNSIIPFYINILYRLLNNPDFIATKIGCEKVSFSEMVALNVPPLKVFKAKDIYQDILVKPAELIKPVLPRLSIHNLQIKDSSIRITNNIFKALAQNKKANDIFEKLVSDYKFIEQQKNNELKKLGKQLTSDSNQQFIIEESAGKIIYASEKQQKLVAKALIDSPEFCQLIIDVAYKYLPSPSKQLSHQWALALNFANQKPESVTQAKSWKIERRAKTRSKLDIANLLSIYCQANQSYSVEKTGLKPKDTKQLHQLIHEALVEDIQNQTCEKIITKLKNALKTKDIDLAFQALELLAKEEIPGLDSPATMLIQREENILLRDRQVKAFKNLISLTDNKSEEPIEKITPGGGKSKVILPVLAEVKARGDNLVVFEVPAALLPTNHIDLNCISQRLFGKRAHRFEFDRNSNCAPERLEHLYQHFIEVMTTRAYLVTTGESIQSLELKYLELLLTENEKDNSWCKQVFWLDKITAIFRYHSLCIIDEAHAGLWIKKKLNYTSGCSKPLNPEIFKDAIAIYNFINLDFIKQAPNFDINYDWTNFKTDLATKLIKESNSPLKAFVTNAMLRFGTAIEDSLRAYLLDQGEMPELIIHATAKEQQSFSFFKQQINTVLPDTLRRKLNVDYGASRRNDLNPIEATLAIPYRGNNAPKENSRFGNELDAINCTIQMMLLKGLSKAHLLARIKEWQSLAAHELFQNTKIKHLDETPTARGFAILDVGCGLSLSQIDTDNPQQLATIYEFHKSNRFLIFSFLEEQSLKLINQDARIYHSDSFNHIDQYASVICLTGTPSNHTTFHQRLSYNPINSLGSDGYILEVLNDKNTLLNFVDYQNPSKFLKKILAKSAARERTRAIIDINATFNGVFNAVVAKDLAAYIKKYPTHFSHHLKHVLYFTEEQILCALEVTQPNIAIVLGTSEEKEINLILGSTPQERFSFYDELHKESTDLTQAEDANALVLIDENIEIDQYEQGIMRMRLIGQKQTIELIAPTRLKNLNRKDLTIQWSSNQRQLLLVDNLYAAKGQMRNYLRRLLLSQVQELPSANAELKAELAQKFRWFFEDIPSMELFALYGAMSKQEKTLTILNHFKTQLLERLNTCYQAAGISPSVEELNAIKDSLESIIEKARPLCLETYEDSCNARVNDVQIQKEVQKEQQKEQLNLNICFDPVLDEAKVHDWDANEVANFYNGKGLMELMSKTLNSVCPNKNQTLFSNALQISSNFARVYQSQKDYLNVFSKPVFLIWYHFKYKLLKATIVTPQEVVQIARHLNENSHGWIATTQDYVIAGQPPQGILNKENYQALREQLRFFNGELNSLVNQETPLIWLKIEPLEKLEFFEKELKRFRPGSEIAFPLLKAVVIQENREAIDYIIKHPFEDLSQFDWKELVPGIIPAQEAEYKKIAELFNYLNKHWLENENLNLMTFNIPINYLDYIESHLNHLLTFKKLLNNLSIGLDYIHSEEEKSCFTTCLAVTIEDFYKASKESQFANIEALYLLQSYPALQGKSLNPFLKVFIKTVTLQSEYLFRALQWFGKNIIELLPLEAMIKAANDKELKLLITTSLSEPLTEPLQFLLAERCQTKDLINQFLKRTELSEGVLQVLLNKTNLDEQQLLQILKLTKNSITFELIEEHQAASTIIRKAVYQSKQLTPEHLLLSLARKKLENEDLLTILANPQAVTIPVLKAIVRLTTLNRPVISALLSHPKITSKLINEAIKNGVFSADRALEIVSNSTYSNENQSLLVNNLLTNNHLSVKALRAYINKIPNRKNLSQALSHPRLATIGLEIWFDDIESEISELSESNMNYQLLVALNSFKAKALSHVIQSRSNPDYEEAAETAVLLYHKLQRELGNYYRDPDKKVFPLRSCKLAIQKASPILKVHRGYKQDFLDIINTILAIITLKCLQTESKSWRFFKVKTESMEILDKLSENLEQVSKTVSCAK